MFKLNRLPEILVLAAVVLLGHPDTARAQTLIFSPSSVAATISGPGGIFGPTSVGVSSTTPISSLFVSGVNTTDHTNWLCATVSGTTTVIVYIGANSTCTANTSQLSPGQSYTGSISVQGNGGALIGTFNVSVTVGSTASNGVAADPPSVSFAAASGAQVASKTVSVTVNGSAQPISSVNFTPTSGVAFLSTTYTGSVATLSVSTNLSNGVYSGVLRINTIFGSVDVQVTLTIGSSSSNGIVATPSSVTFNAAAGAVVTPQTVSVTVNGAATSINNASFTPTSGGVSFLTTSVSGSVATLSVSNTNLANGIYTGVETLSTIFGSVTVNVTLNIGSGNPSLVASPNPVNFSLQNNGAAPSQNVSVTFNGSPANVTSATATTNTNQNWLLPSVSATQGTVNVAINGFAGPGGTFLSSGTYTGTVTVNTQQGQTTFQVSLTVAGTPTLQVNPAALNFAWQVGTTIPSSQTIAISSSGTAINYGVSSSIFSGNPGWLVVTPSGTQQTTPGTITVSVQPTGLTAGVTYSGNIQINTFGGATNPTVNIPVNLLVSNSPILNVTPTAINFTAQAGGNPAAQILTLQSSSSALSYTVSSSITTPSGFNWLQVPAQSGTTPGTVTVNANTAGLGPGTYSATITLTSPNAGNATVTVPVTLTITAGAILQVSPSALSFAYQIGQTQPNSQTVTVGAPGGQVGFSVAAQTTSGGNWLNVSPATGNAPGTFVVSVTTAGLAAGSYTGTITVTPSVSGAVQTVNVSLVVSPNALLLVTPPSVAFSAAQGASAATPALQNVSVTSTDGTPVTFNIGVTYVTGASGWLFVNSSTGVTPSNLTFSSNPFGLSIGTYTATVTLTATTANIANSPQTIQVTLTILSSNTLAASPTSLSFTQAVNGSAPAPQSLAITSSGSSSGAQITFSAAVSLNQGQGWLTVSPTSGTTPATLIVTANGAGLAAGSYTGQISLSSPAVATQTVNVTLTVSGLTGGFTSSGSMAHLASAGFWGTTFTLVNNGTANAQARLNFFDDNGNPLPLALTFPQTSPTPQSPVASLDRTLAPGAAVVFQATGPDNQATQVGWAQLLTTGNIDGFAVFTQTIGARQQEAVVPVDERTSGSYVLWYDNTGGFATGVALANIAAQSAGIPVVIRDDTGLVLRSDTITLPAHGHTSFELAARFGNTTLRRGTVEFQTPAGGQISVLGLRFNPALAFSSIPSLVK